MDSCGVLELHSLLGKKWTYGLLFNIGSIPISYSELEAMTQKEINPTLLSERLNSLQEFNLIQKKINNGRLAYSLTSHGANFKELLLEVKKMVEKHSPVSVNCKHGSCESCKSFNLAKVRFSQ